MHKIDSDGATIDNKFTEGTPGVIPATVVSAAIANAWQEEIVTLVEDAGLVLKTSSTDTFDQLLEAVKILIASGGSLAPIAQALSNNAGPLDVTDFPLLDSTVIKTRVCTYDIIRRTDSNDVIETGHLYFNYNPDAAGAENDKWSVSFDSKFDDAGVTFDLDLDSGTLSKLRYTTNDLTGTTYSGTLRITGITNINL